MIDRETTAQHLERLIARISQALAAADDSEQQMVGAHLHSALRTATALRAIPGDLNSFPLGAPVTGSIYEDVSVPSRVCFQVAGLLVLKSYREDD